MHHHTLMTPLLLPGAAAQPEAKSGFLLLPLSELPCGHGPWCPGAGKSRRQGSCAPHGSWDFGSCLLHETLKRAGLLLLLATGMLAHLLFAFSLHNMRERSCQILQSPLATTPSFLSMWAQAVLPHNRQHIAKDSDTPGRKLKDLGAKVVFSSTLLNEGCDPKREGNTGGQPLAVQVMPGRFASWIMVSTS